MNGRNNNKCINFSKLSNTATYFFFLSPLLISPTYFLLHFFRFVPVLLNCVLLSPVPLRNSRPSVLHLLFHSPSLCFFLFFLVVPFLLALNTGGSSFQSISTACIYSISQLLLLHFFARSLHRRRGVNGNGLVSTGAKARLLPVFLLSCFFSASPSLMSPAYSAAANQAVQLVRRAPLLSSSSTQE